MHWSHVWWARLACGVILGLLVLVGWQHAFGTVTLTTPIPYRAELGDPPVTISTVAVKRVVLDAALRTVEITVKAGQAEVYRTFTLPLATVPATCRDPQTYETALVNAGKLTGTVGP